MGKVTNFMEPNEEANHDNYLISLGIKNFESPSEACLLSFLVWYSVFLGKWSGGDES